MIWQLPEDARGGLIAYPFPEPPIPGETAVELAEGVLWLRMPLPMALDHVNIYALRDGDGWALVDTGMDTKRSRAIWEKALAGPLGGLPVTRILLTHHHPDHVGLVGWFQGQGAELLTSRTAWLMARMLQLDAQDLPVPETLLFWKRAGMDPEIIKARAEGRPFNFADCVAPMPLGYTRLKEGDVLELGGRSWDVAMGGGHAPEHVTLWSRDDGLVIGGDQLLPSISPNLGVYATEPEADPVADWLEACARFAQHAREDHLVLGGHKLPFTGLPTRLRQLIANHHGALDRLEAHLGVPRSAAECFQPLFKRSIGEGEYGLALVEAVAHLNHLRAEGRAIRAEGIDGVYRFQRA